LINRNTTPISTIVLSNILFVPGLSTNFLSIPLLEDCSISAYIYNSVLELIRNKEVLAVATREDNIYKLELRTQNKTILAVDDNNVFSLLYRRFGYAGEYYFLHLYKAVAGLEKKVPKNPSYNKLYNLYITAKQACIIYREPVPKATEILFRVFIDIWGPYYIADIQGNTYFLGTSNDHSRYKFIRISTGRSSLYNEFLQLKAQIKLQTGRKIKRVYIDNTGEFIKLGVELRDYSITSEYTSPYSPNKNRVSEYLNRILITIAKSILFDTKLPESFWGPAVEAVYYLHNRLPIGIKGKTPFELFYSKKPDISNLRVFGYLVYTINPLEIYSKLDPNSTKTIFIGYTETRNQYKLYNPVKNKIFRSSNIIFYKKKHLE
jgi:hypothetical protein